MKPTILETVVNFWMELAERLEVEVNTVGYHVVRFTRKDATVLTIQIVPTVASIDIMVDSPQEVILTVIDSLDSTTSDLTLRMDYETFTKKVS